MTLTCPNCGNDRNFLVKTLQMHVVNVEGGRVEVTEESRPAVLEVLCDECELALKFEEFEDTLRKEVLLTIGARCTRAAFASIPVRLLQSSRSRGKSIHAPSAWSAWDCQAPGRWFVFRPGAWCRRIAGILGTWA